jgi:hypothetical protein
VAELTNIEELINTLEEASEDSHVRRHQDAIDKAIDILQQLDQWCNAYPEDIFIPMTSEDWADHHKVLKKARRSGSAAAADCMRYTINGIKKVINQ